MTEWEETLGFLSPFIFYWESRFLHKNPKFKIILFIIYMREFDMLSHQELYMSLNMLVVTTNWSLFKSNFSLEMGRQ